jgi:hypothetical protein
MGFALYCTGKAAREMYFQTLALEVRICVFMHLVLIKPQIAMYAFIMCYARTHRFKITNNTMLFCVELVLTEE